MGERETPSWLSRTLKQATGLVALTYLVLYLVLALLRLRYPFELEWMEGGMVDHVRRILAGQKLYVAPSLEFVPYIYPPLYFYLSALVAKVVGVGLFPLRLVSLISSALSLALIFLLVKKETGDRLAGIIAAGFFAATYRLSGAWLDIARIDSLFLVFSLAGLYLVRFGRSHSASSLAGFLFFLSFLTKQNALIIFAPLVLYSLLQQGRRSFGLIGIWVLLVVSSTLWLDDIHSGWYRYYIFDLPRQHPLVFVMFTNFWRFDLLAAIPIACLMGLFVLLKGFRGRDQFLFYGLMALGFLGSAYVSRVHSGAYDNCLIPAYAGIALLLGYGIPRLLPLASFSYLVVLLQFGLLYYNPRQQVPTESDRQAGQQLIKKMAQIPGEIYLPGHGYLPSLAGKKTWAQGMAIVDILKGKDGPIKQGMLNEMGQALANHKFGAIFVGRDRMAIGAVDLDRYYAWHENTFANEKDFWPVTGFGTRPEGIYFGK